MRRLIRMTFKDLLVIGLPILAVTTAAFWAAYQFVQPAPPKQLTIITGVQDGSFHHWALRYKEVFERNGITLKLRTSTGPVENLERLIDPKQVVDIGFVQGGTVMRKDTTGLVSLGVLYPEPLWLFYHGKEYVTSIADLKGKRIAVGVRGSGTRELAMEILEAHGVAQSPTVLSPLSDVAAVHALAYGEVDAAFILSGAQSAAAWTAFYTPGVEIFDYTQADAYTRRFPYLSTITLPRGAIDLERDIPKRNTTLIATTAMLVARESLHPALADLMLQAASEAHGQAGLFQKAGEFPTPKGVETPLSKDAERYYTSGKPFLQRYLPFWAATLIDRLIVMLVPVIAILYPLIRVAPYLYSWRVRMRVFRYYGELKLLELQAQEAPNSRTSLEWIAELERIEQAANRIPTPNAFAHQVYTLRTHVQLVRRSLLKRFGAVEPTNL
ncbi:MAG TPA: TAXI family TRAP transporter solute-binding subunit [Burkholderiales bacterium]|nr:TAXI family TRAP transporter solute-binding subunit [Burkholderiales bacterium]